MLSNVTNLCTSDFHEPVLGSRRPTAVNLGAPGPWPRGPGAGGLGGIIARCLGGIVARISFFRRTSVVIARLSCGE